LTDLARDLVRVNVDGIVTESTPAAVAAKQVTARTPIVARLSSFRSPRLRGRAESAAGGDRSHWRL
jgi:hypothetical protein